MLPALDARGEDPISERIRLKGGREAAVQRRLTLAPNMDKRRWFCVRPPRARKNEPQRHLPRGPFEYLNFFIQTGRSARYTAYSAAIIASTTCSAGACSSMPSACM